MPTGSGKTSGEGENMKEKLIKLIEEMNSNELLYSYTFLSKMFGRSAENDNKDVKCN